MEKRLTPQQRYALQGISDRLSPYNPLSLNVNDISERYNLPSDQAMQVLSIVALVFHHLAQLDGSGLSRKSVNFFAGPLINRPSGQRQIDEVKQGVEHHTLSFTRKRRKAYRR